MTVYVGIDPGAAGGLAIILPREFNRLAMAILTPATLRETAALLRNWYDMESAPPRVFIEKVHAMPGQGVVSMFSFGRRYGELLGILATLNMEPVEVEPRVWQARVLGGGRGENTKDRAIHFCGWTYPEVNLIPPRCRVPHDGMADALCLAHYGYLRSNS